MVNWPSKEELENIKEGDTIIYGWSGYRSKERYSAKVIRTTKTKIFTEKDTFNRSGVKLPRDRWINAYIEKVIKGDANAE